MIQQSIDKLVTNPALAKTIKEGVELQEKQLKELQQRKEAYTHQAENLRKQQMKADKEFLSGNMSQETFDKYSSESQRIELEKKEARKQYEEDASKTLGGKKGFMVEVGGKTYFKEFKK